MSLADDIRAYQATGDEAAFNRLWDRYARIRAWHVGSTLRRWAWLLADADRADVESYASEGFLSAVRVYDGRRPFEALVHARISGRCLNYVDWRLHRLHGGEVLGDYPVDTGIALRLDVADAVVGLSEAQRVAWFGEYANQRTKRLARWKLALALSDYRVSA